MPRVTKESDKMEFIDMVAIHQMEQDKTIKNLQFHNRGLAEALREKHNRDVELTDLLTHLLDRYGDLMTPLDRERIEELTKPAE